MATAHRFPNTEKLILLTLLLLFLLPSVLQIGAEAGVPAPSLPSFSLPVITFPALQHHFSLPLHLTWPSISWIHVQPQNPFQVIHAFATTGNFLTVTGASMPSALEPGGALAPVGYWSLTDGSGTSAFDNSGNGNTGTLQQSPTWTTTVTPFGYGYSLGFTSASKQNVTIPSSSTLNPASGHWSISALAYITSLSTTSFIVAKGGFTNLGYDMFVQTDGTLHCEYSDGTHDSIAFVGTVSINKWYLLTCILNSAFEAQAQINVQQSVSSSTATSAAISPTNALVIGGGSFTGEYSNSYVSDVRLYNFALTPIEVSYLDQNPPSGQGYYSSSAPDTAYPATLGELSCVPRTSCNYITSWKLDSGSSTSITPTSGVIQPSTVSMTAAHTFTFSTATEYYLKTTGAAPAVQEYTSNLAGWWTFDDRNGTSVTDSSGNGYTGTLVPSGATGNYHWVDNGSCVRSSCMAFGGTGGDVSISPNPNPSGSFTVSAWFETSVLSSTDAGIVDHGYVGSETGWIMRVHNGELQCGIQVSPTFISLLSSQTVNDGKWHLGDCVFASGSSLSVYVDSVAGGTSSTTLTNLANANDFIIGSDDAGNNFNGMVDDVRLYSTALTAAQVGYIYNNPQNFQVAHWSFSEGSGTTTSDQSGNGYTGTITMGSGSWLTSCYVGSCLSYDGSSTTVVTKFQETLPESFSVWFKATSLPSSGNIVFLVGDATNAQIGLYNTGSTTEVRASGMGLGGNLVITGITSGQWYFTALSISPTTQDLCVNTSCISQNVAAASPTLNGFFPFGSNDGGGAFFNGVMDDISVYSIALSSSQISTLYTNPPTGEGYYTSGQNAYAASDSILLTGSASRQITYQYNVDGGSTVTLTEGTGVQVTNAIVMSADHTVNWLQMTQYQMTLISGSSGALSGSQTGDGWYNSGSTVTFTANSIAQGWTANHDYWFYACSNGLQMQVNVSASSGACNTGGPFWQNVTAANAQVVMYDASATGLDPINVLVNNAPIFYIWNPGSRMITIQNAGTAFSFEFGTNIQLTIDLVEQPGSTAKLTASNFLQWTCLSGGINTVTNVVDGNNVLYCDSYSTALIFGNTRAGLTGESSSSNSTVRWCLAQCLASSIVIPSSSTTLDYDYWGQDNVSGEFTPPVSAPFAHEQPTFTYTSFGQQLTVNLGVLYQTLWADNGSTWQTQSPFYYNLKGYTPTTTSGSITKPQTIDVTYNQVQAQLSSNPLTDLEQGLVAPAIVLVFSNVIGIQWFLGLVIIIIDVALYLKSHNVWIPLIIFIASFIVFTAGASLNFLPSVFGEMAFLFLVLGIAGTAYRIYTSRN